MDEDLNEDEVEERLYAMLHYAAEPQHDAQNSPEELARALAAAPTSTLRRYWRASEPAPAAYSRINKPPPTTPQPLKKDYPNTQTPQNIKNDKNKTASTTTPCTDTSDACKQEPDNFDMDIFQIPISADTKITVQIIESEPTPDNIVNLESSDEDEVVEVALPPKPTITIESSDEEETPSKVPKKKNNIKKNTEKQEDREISTSPVPSVVSSVSDDFIRGDCIALNISSKKPAYHVFDFSLHGTDLVETPAKKKKKKNKSSSTPVSATQVASTTPAKTTPGLDSCFATPKTKSKKKQKIKAFTVTELHVPHMDVYDSDSNHSTDINKALTTFTVSDKSCPSTDVYESDSSQSEILRATEPGLSASSNNSSTESVNKVAPTAAAATLARPHNSPARPQNSPARQQNTPARPQNTSSNKSFVDLTDDTNNDEDAIEENIVMANVTGFQESDNYSDDEDQTKGNKQLGSTKVPKILFESLDFDFLKGKGNSRKRRFSITSLREEMEKFYNESWGGEDFNHREIQKTMSRDKSLWEIDPKDRMPTPVNRKPTCNYCGRVGHRDDACYQKPRACHMCGRRGHVSTRCPNKICVNCGEPNHIYTTRCRRCAGWAHVRCVTCRRPGHPAPHCPDLWRRYHNTIDNNVPLAEAGLKPPPAQQCSGCARRGHLAHACQHALPYSGLPLLHPAAHSYTPLYPADPAPPPHARKRRSSSPPRHDNAKKRSSESDKRTSEFDKRTSESEKRNLSSDKRSEVENAASPAPPPRREERSKSADGDKAKPHRERRMSSHMPKDKEPQPSNTDKNGQVIQDNQVSDTSDAVTTARIYLTEEARERLRTAEGQSWLRDRAAIATLSDQDPFLHVTGTLNDQEAFQAELREWCAPGANSAPATPAPAPAPIDNIPKNRNNVLRQLSKALESLETPLGEPSALYRELTYLRTHRDQLLKQKVVSPKQLANNRDYIRTQLKRLNMVLLGQAGLGGGARHVAALRDLRARLHAARRKLLPAELRAEIAEHYCCVFAATPRDDYDSLINLYYARKPPRPKKKKKPVNINFEIHENNKPVPSPAAKGAASLVEQAVSCWRQLGAARGGGAGAQRARLQLTRKLHSHISSASHASSKQLKKMRKAVEQTHEFLRTNNY